MNATQIKAAVRERDGFRCTLCGMSRADHVAQYGRELDVHRVVPGSTYSLNDGCCVTVCRACHASLPKGDHNSDGHSGRLLPARVADALWDALQATASEERRSVAQMVSILLEEALTARGRWGKPPARPQVTS